MLQLTVGDYRLDVDPARGGSILRFDWRGHALMRASTGPTIFDVACFPLVPFSNRIAFGRFDVEGREVVIAPNFPGDGHPHPLHGFGWLAAWGVVEESASGLTLEHAYAGEEWPWSYAARQTFDLSEDGLRVTLALKNHSDAAMPVGLGLHPYFSRDADTVYTGLHRGEWTNTVDCLPHTLDQRDAATDWWAGAPVGKRAVDTVYTDRAGALRIDWPSRSYSLAIEPSANLAHTVVYTPPGEDFFCVEPVSHATDAVRPHADMDPIAMLAPGAEMVANVRFRASALE